MGPLGALEAGSTHPIATHFHAHYLSLGAAYGGQLRRQTRLEDARAERLLHADLDALAIGRQARCELPRQLRSV